MKQQFLALVQDLNDWIKSHPLIVAVFLAGLIVGVILAASGR